MRSRSIEAVRGWLAQIWQDLKASTDTNVLSALRFLGLLYGPIDQRLPIDQALRKARGYRLAPHVGWRHALGSVTYLLFAVLVVTGVLLSFYYRPSAQEAYPSLQYIVSEVPFGWLVRDVHAWAANLIVIVLLAHMARVFFDAAYKPPRETNWIVGLLLLFVVLAFGATGYLLPWGQWSYWTVTEVLNTLHRLPLLGRFVPLAMGDEIVSGATLSRFFALHVVVLPWVAFALLIFHSTLVRKHGIAPGKTEPPAGALGVPFYPNHLTRSFMVSVGVLALTFTVAILFPLPIAEPADPYEPPVELVSTWAPVDVSLALIRFMGPIGFSLFTLLGLSLALLPLFDRGPERDLRRRPVAAALGVAFFVGFLGLWLAGRALGSIPPSAAVQREAVEERVAPARPPVPLLVPGPAPGSAAPRDSGLQGGPVQ